jgi:hypothetical protein
LSDRLSRKLDLYTLHAHLDKEPPNYTRLFRRLAELEPNDREMLDEDRLIAISQITIANGVVRLVVLEGPVGVVPTIYNIERQRERRQPLRPGDVVVNRTHVLIDVDSRRTIVEYNQRGAKANDVAKVLQHSARRIKAFSKLQLSVTPVLGSAFTEAIDAFDRIKAASVKLVQPNYGWSDWVDPLTGAADDSDAAAANVEFTAKRNGSLSKRRGVIGFLRQTSTMAKSPVESATVLGRRPDDEADTRISSRGYTEHRRVSVARRADGQADDDDTFEAMAEFDEELGGESSEERDSAS